MGTDSEDAEWLGNLRSFLAQQKHFAIPENCDPYYYRKRTEVFNAMNDGDYENALKLNDAVLRDFAANLDDVVARLIILRELKMDDQARKEAILALDSLKAVKFVLEDFL